MNLRISLLAGTVLLILSHSLIQASGSDGFSMRSRIFCFANHVHFRQSHRSMVQKKEAWGRNQDTVTSSAKAMLAGIPFTSVSCKTTPTSMIPRESFQGLLSLSFLQGLPGHTIRNNRWSAAPCQVRKVFQRVSQPILQHCAHRFNPKLLESTARSRGASGLRAAAQSARDQGKSLPLKLLNKEIYEDAVSCPLLAWYKRHDLVPKENMKESQKHLMEQGIRFENRYIELRYGRSGTLITGRGAEERARNTAKHMQDIEREGLVGEVLFQV
jgi:hypothetical protein